MPTHSKIVKAAEIAQQIGCEAIQIFASNPTAWSPPAGESVDCEAFAQATRALNLDPVALHAPYLINLAAPDDIIWEKSIALLSWTMQRGRLLGARYVIFHTGSHRGSGLEAGIARVAQGMKLVLSKSPAEVVLLLENGVGAGNAFGDQFEHLAAILKLVPEYRNNIGICLDTAHLWGAGHDISSAQAVHDVLCHFEQVVGIEQLKVLHLNDTSMALGSHRDVHKRLGEGLIGEGGLRALLRDPRLNHVAVLMETPIKTDDHDKEDWVHDADQIARAKELRSSGC